MSTVRERRRPHRSLSLMSAAGGRRFWVGGLVAHVALVATIIALAYAGVLPPVSRIVRGADLWMHALLIGLLGFFLDGVLRHRPLIPGRLPWLRLAPLVVLALAGTEEILQALSPHRTASILDFAADVVGVVFFTWLAPRVEAWRTRRFLRNRRFQA